MRKQKKKMISMIIAVLIMTFLIGGTALAYAEMDVMVNGIPMVLNSDYDAKILPEGFYETDHYYNGDTYWGGTDEETESIDIYYLRCDSDPSKTGWYTLDNNGNFVLYQAVNPNAGKTEAQVAAEATAPAVQPGTVTGSVINGSGISVTICTLDSDVEVPYGYEEAQVASDNEMVSCYRKSDATGASLDAYLIYGTVDGSTRGWYTYDLRDNTLQRFMSNAETQIIEQQEGIISDLKVQLEDLNDKYNRNVGNSKNLFLVAILIAVVCLFLMINAMLKRRHITMDLEDRIVDLKRNGGIETAKFTKSEAARYKRLDSAAEGRSYRYSDDLDDNPFADSASVSRKQKKKEHPFGDLENLEDLDDLAFLEEDKPVRKKPVSKSAPAAEEPGKAENRRRRKVRDEYSDRSARDGRTERTGSGRSSISERRSSASGRNSISAHAAAARSAESSTMAPPDATIQLPADETRKRRDALSNTSPIVNGSVSKAPTTGRKIRRDRDLTMRAAGDAQDSDLDMLEKNLGQMTEDVLRKPDRGRKVPKFSKVDIAEIGNEDFDTDFIDL